jgi:hypothetical protein
MFERPYRSFGDNFEQLHHDLLLCSAARATGAVMLGQSIIKRNQNNDAHDPAATTPKQKRTRSNAHPLHSSLPFPQIVVFPTLTKNRQIKKKQ